MREPVQVWAAFSRDPRDPAARDLRASDADRDVVLGVLGESFADGRLDRHELDERTAATADARTLGALLAPLEGLVPRDDAPSSALTPAELDARALESWRSDRREALWGVLTISAIVWTIWLVGSFGDAGFEPYFPWPVFVTLVGLVNLARVQARREESVREERRRLEKKQRKAIEKRREETE
ncbi:DUF1707 SHOCT-like domain-containing protein [Nocardioides coralli]|uniref:DUF1707 SHOCT-like domain-containing protein n=1 Tax=Nocardioides coralli TaxID=2872154 RepID=UPI001CA3EF21|nr:DUF1707 domain-containing protein [Nocardioides coralli]QZY30638.1 DUF1707 domain-containing protein [Nocardioides coralli]